MHVYLMQNVLYCTYLITQVLHLRLTDGNVTSVTELLYDDGQLISGSTAALVYNKQLLVGSTIDHLVLCQVNVPI